MIVRLFSPIIIKYFTILHIPRIFSCYERYRNGVSRHWQCPNDYIICYGQHATNLECGQYQISRYQHDQVTNKVPRKVLNHIPIIPCFQQLLKWKNIEQFMDYHAWKRCNSIMWMPTNCISFTKIDESWWFFKE